MALEVISDTLARLSGWQAVAAVLLSPYTVTHWGFQVFSYPLSPTSANLQWRGSKFRDQAEWTWSSPPTGAMQTSPQRDAPYLAADLEDELLCTTRTQGPAPTRDSRMREIQPEREKSRQEKILNAED
ncbi:hypothetical protein ElyMa_006822200 [Elysia marginata]|uniref:Uncharacterized protein n=1 Tax=Elysia marginata TaxID=1093978 RepID=A0AAV4J3T7_9GAST|nr:hypothetical protein ElyMa_006822200 [Elysia marginata]